MKLHVDRLDPVPRVSDGQRPLLQKGWFVDVKPDSPTNSKDKLKLSRKLLSLLLCRDENASFGFPFRNSENTPANRLLPPVLRCVSPDGRLKPIFRT